MSFQHRNTRTLAVSWLLSLGFCLTSCLQVTTTTQRAMQLCSPTGAQVKTQAFLQVALRDAPVACALIQNYTCSHRIFSPDATDSKYGAMECVTNGVLNGSCFDVSTYSFSTKMASSYPHMDPKEFEPGGSLNYQEYSCFNSKVQALGLGSSLNDALKLAYNKCNGTVQ